MFQHHQTLLARLLLCLLLILSTICLISTLLLIHAAVDESAAQDGQNECIEDTHDDVNNFYAWPINPPPAKDSLMNALFPDLTRLQSAWEVHPLLSRVSFSPQQQLEGALPLDQIPTILHNRSSVSNYSGANENKGDPLLSLFDVDDTPALLSQPMMDHGSDYKLVKKVIMPPEHAEAGEEYSGTLPKSHFNVDEVLHAFHYGAFSVVINRMQKRWKPIAKMARAMEEEFGAMGVGVNLYLTPEVSMEEEDYVKHGEVRQAFEAHWDWMDVIVVQLSGRKRWSVASEPSIYLSGKDQKRKPSRKDVEALRHYSEFTLCPGDVLYIPRGHIHNASTVVFEKFNNAGKKSELTYLAGCPSYPKDVASAELLSNRLDGPSLHVTFGLLQASQGTIESLLHHALDAYFASSDSSKHNAVAIPAETSCPRPVRKAINYDLKWKSVFHHLLAEVARRKHRCDSPSKRGIVMGKHEGCDGTAVLRQSVPLMPLTKYNMEEDTIDDENTQHQYLNLKLSYLLALDTFASSASVPNTLEFVVQILEPPSDDELTFHYPGYSEEDVILCPDLLKSLSDDIFIQLLQSFRQFAKDNFHEALKGLNHWGEERRMKNRQQQRLDLDMVGQ